MKERLDKLHAQTELFWLEHVYQFDLIRFKRITNYKLPDMSYGLYLAKYNRTPELVISVMEDKPQTSELRAIIAKRKLNYGTALNRILEILDPKLTCDIRAFGLCRFYSTDRTEHNLRLTTLDEIWELLTEIEKQKILKKL
jgi:hypothetical protein